MANQAWLSRLLETGNYSDLTLECEGKKFKVHKSVVCIQSPVLAAAVRNFKVRLDSFD